MSRAFFARRSPQSLADPPCQSSFFTPEAVQGIISVYENGGGLVGTGVLTLPALGGFTGTVNEFVRSSAESEIFSVNVLTGAVFRHAHHRSRSVLAGYSRFPRADVKLGRHGDYL